VTATSSNPPPLGSGAIGRIIRVDRRLQHAAASRLVSTTSRSDERAGTRFLSDARAIGIPLDHFWAWESRSGEIEAAALAVCNPGRTALVFASRPIGRGHGALVVQCLNAACRDVACGGVILAQALLEPSERAERKCFQQAEFQLIANLTYLEKSLGGAVAPRVAWPAGVTLEQYDESNHGDFITALSESYMGSLDCPALNGLRSPGDILAGHRATGEFDPALWTLLRVDGKPGGLLLLNPSPRQGTIELVYLGLASHARRRGLGSMLMAHGLQQVQPRGETAMTLAVDDRNAPAIRLYRRLGFRRVLQRCAMVRILAGPGATG
jgi:ribosomal protein S18 acetylase RimI-like enzyme